MSPIVIVLTILLIVCSALLTVIIMLQKNRGQGMGSAVAGAGANYFGKNKGATREAMMKNLTIILSIVFIVAVIVVDIFQLYL